MKIRIYDQTGQLNTHQVFGAMTYPSGLQLVLVDCPWLRHSNPSLFATARLGYRQANTGDPNDWRNIWGEVEDLIAWASASTVGSSARLKGRNLTLMDPRLLPPVLGKPVSHDSISF